MTQLIRAFNNAGVEQLRSYLTRLQNGVAEGPPTELLNDAYCTNELAIDLTIASQRFATRFALGHFLYDLLKPLPAEELDKSTGLWAWLSLFFIDQVNPVARDGLRHPGQDYRHIPDFSYRYRYRHLLYGPYQVYRRHGPYSIVLLSGLPNSESSLYHEITSRQDLIANRGVIEAALDLYMDRKKGGPKQGCQDPKTPPGSVRRFVRVLQQLDVNYDVYGLSGRDIIELLPPEFDVWAHRGQTNLSLPA